LFYTPANAPLSEPEDYFFVDYTNGGGAEIVWSSSNATLPGWLACVYTPAGESFFRTLSYFDREIDPGSPAFLTPLSSWEYWTMDTPAPLGNLGTGRDWNNNPGTNPTNGVDLNGLEYSNFNGVNQTQSLSPSGTPELNAGQDYSFSGYLFVPSGFTSIGTAYLLSRPPGFSMRKKAADTGIEIRFDNSGGAGWYDVPEFKVDTWHHFEFQIDWTRSTMRFWLDNDMLYAINTSTWNDDSSNNPLRMAGDAVGANRCECRFAELIFFTSNVTAGEVYFDTARRPSTWNRRRFSTARLDAGDWTALAFLDLLGENLSPSVYFQYRYLGL
jgi:hypothetical protein